MNSHVNTSLEKLDSTLEKEGVFRVVKQLRQHFPSARIYLVGGTIRDALLRRDSKTDRDLVVCNVPAKELEDFLGTLGDVSLVGKHFGVFKLVPAHFGQVGIHATAVIDIALPRTEHALMTGGYHDFNVQSDPDLPIEKDLERRDFTINAMAYDLLEHRVVDVFDGSRDLEIKCIRTVGVPSRRFAEDFTRLLRAVRFACQLSFDIEAETFTEMKGMSETIRKLPVERVREEFNKILMSDQAERGVRLLQEVGLLRHIARELEDGIGVTQNKNHIYTVYEHNVRALGHATERGYSLEVRLAALFHDVGKPMTKQGEGYNSTFHGHDIVGGRLTREILTRLKYPNDTINLVSHLVRHHMFYYSIGEVTDAGVRRLLVRLGSENIENFLRVRICDRLGMGRPKAKPYKLTELERRLQEVQMDPIAPKMLALNGNDVMNLLSIMPGPRIGLLTRALLGEVLDDPKRNTKDYLSQRVRELDALSDEDLKKMTPDVEHYDRQRKEEFFIKYKEVE